MAYHALQTSFTAGELSPALFARVDLDKYHSGAAKLRNFLVDYKGGAPSRPGTQFVGMCKNIPGRPRLIPFIVSTLATYGLEFGQYYVRFISNGAYIMDPVHPANPLEVVSPYAAVDLPLVKYTQSANVLTLTHPLYPVYNLTRTSPTAFTLTQDVIGSSLTPPTNVAPVQQNGASSKYRYGYVVTSVVGGEESVASFPKFVDGDILNQTSGIVNRITWDENTADFFRVYRVGPTPSGNGNNGTPVASVYGFLGSTETNVFVDNNIAPDFSQTPPTFQDPFSPGQIANVAVLIAGAGYTDPIYPLTFTGDGTGAAGYAVADPVSGGIVGVVLTSAGKNYTHCIVTDATGFGATYSNTLGQQSGTYPSAVGYDQQRRFFGGTLNFPEAFVCSQPGAYDNFNTNPIQLDSDAITASLASRQVNAIKSFTAMPTGLVILTTGGGFLVSGGSANAAITPSSIVAFPQASSGCNDLPPLVINYDILYGQNRGAVVRDLAFNFYVQSYTGTDRSVLASHLFYNHTLVEWTYAEEPFRLVQIIRDDGILLNFTYVPEQEIFAWTQSDTNGFFRSIMSIPEGQVNAVYVIVERFVNGTYRYFTERFAPGLFETIQDSWCVDCGLATPNISPAATATLSAATGNGVVVSVDFPVFAPGDVGKSIWGNHGKADIVGFIDTSTVTVNVIQDFQTIPNDPNNRPRRLEPQIWFLNANVTNIAGLDHLEGMQVWAQADGMPVGPFTVVGGAIVLPQPASIINVGLAFQGQVQTLKLDLGEPTIQGKRKQISAVTVRVFRALGLKVGPTFDRLTEMKGLIPAFPPMLISDDARTLIQGSWSRDGQICFQLDYPVPATILGVMPEVVVGDTGR